MAEIKGYTAEEVAESRKKELLDKYNSCMERLDEIKKHETIIKCIRIEYDESIKSYRMNSVDRVLDYIRAKKITDSSELDTLLCHCQNKLNGNIDGTEIDLSRYGVKE